MLDSFKSLGKSFLCSNDSHKFTAYLNLFQDKLNRKCAHIVYTLQDFIRHKYKVSTRTL